MKVGLPFFISPFIVRPSFFRSGKSTKAPTIRTWLSEATCAPGHITWDWFLSPPVSFMFIGVFF